MPAAPPWPAMTRFPSITWPVFRIRASGMPLAMPMKRRLPYCRPFVKYTPTWPRSFMPQNQELRDLVARMKLIPVRKLIQGKRLLFCEDSIVRGTQLKDNIQILFDYGARKSTCGRRARP